MTRAGALVFFALFLFINWAVASVPGAIGVIFGIGCALTVFLLVGFAFAFRVTPVTARPAQWWRRKSMQPTAPEPEAIPRLVLIEDEQPEQVAS